MSAPQARAAVWPALLADAAALACAVAVIFGVALEMPAAERTAAAMPESPAPR